MTKDKYKEQFAQAAANAFRNIYAEKFKAVGEEQIFSPGFIYDNLEKPKDPSMGRFALPVFKYVKLLEDKPPEIAAKIAPETNKLLKSNNGSSLVETLAVGAYLNVRPDSVAAATDTVSSILNHGDSYGNSNIGQKQKLLIEYSSPNIAKPFGVGHLRSTAIGNSLRKILKALGYDVEGINFLGDWGTQFGKMIVAYKKWGSEDTLSKDSVVNLYDLYVKFHDEAESNPELENEARNAFKNLEQGDKDAVALWETFKDISLTEFTRIYDLLGVEYDWITSESFLNDKMDAAIELLEQAGLTKISQGALIVELDDPNLPPCLLRKADGATLYATRDIAGLLYRWKKYLHFSESLYVVGSAQSDHFKQLFKVIELLENAENLPDKDRMSGKVKHVEFGWVKFGEKTMSTRRGNIIILEDVIDKAVELATQKIKEKNPKLKNLNDVARMIGVGAVIFSQISVRRHKDVNFDWDEVLNFEGETGPYLQYTHARLCSLLRNYEGEPTAAIDFKLLNNDEEQRVIDLLADFPVAIEDAARNYDPVFVATFLIKLSGAFNKFYQRKTEDGKIDKIISENKDLTAARIALVKCVQIVINKGLNLLALKAPEEM